MKPLNTGRSSGKAAVRIAALAITLNVIHALPAQSQVNSPEAAPNMLCLDSRVDFWLEEKDPDAVEAYLRETNPSGGSLQLGKITEVELTSCKEQRDTSLSVPKCRRHDFEGWVYVVRYKYCTRR